MAYLKCLLLVQGCWEKVVADQEGANWLITGSTRGHIALWDMRFQVTMHIMSLYIPTNSHPLKEQWCRLLLA